jgi:hypothetical protein
MENLNSYSALTVYVCAALSGLVPAVLLFIVVLFENKKTL